MRVFVVLLYINAFALRKAKTQLTFVYSECNKVNMNDYLSVTFVTVLYVKSTAKPALKEVKYWSFGTHGVLNSCLSDFR